MSKVINYNKCWCLDRPWCFTSGFTLAFCNLPTQYSLIFSSSTNGDNDKTLLLQLILLCDNKFNFFSENEWFCAIFVNVSYDGLGKQFSEVLDGSWKSQKDSRSFKRSQNFETVSESQSILDVFKKVLGSLKKFSS